MEKMIYTVWKRDGESTDSLAARLRGEVSSRLLRDGAHELRISVADSDVAAALPLRQEHNPPAPDGLVSLWVDTANRRQPLEQTLAASVGRAAGYLVAESVPIVNTRHPVPDGQRTPGMLQVAMFPRPMRLAQEEWLDIWMNGHTQIAIDTQSTFGYRQNVVVRLLTPGAVPYGAIVEENFPAEAMTSPHAFYDAVGDDAKLHERLRIMVASCVRFIDLDTLDVIATSEYTMKSSPYDPRQAMRP